MTEWRSGDRFFLAVDVSLGKERVYKWIAFYLEMFVSITYPTEQRTGSQSWSVSYICGSRVCRCAAGCWWDWHWRLIFSGPRLTGPVPAPAHASAARRRRELQLKTAQFSKQYKCAEAYHSHSLLWTDSLQNLRLSSHCFLQWVKSGTLVDPRTGWMRL